LGLGEIHLNSALNEPLRAEIDLVAAAPDELAALRATLAGRDSFTRYGIDRPPFLSSLNFKLGKSKDGRDVLLVTSSEPVAEPFVTFLVEVDWARGRLMREYTLLLDPPVYSPNESPNSSAPVATAQSSAPPARAGAPAPAAAPSATTPVASAPTTTSTRYPGSGTAATPTSGTYRVSAGDTLSKIARSLGRGAGEGDLDQTMMALFHDNPDAFQGNINVLHRGAILRLPGADEIAALNQREAVKEVARQMGAWRASGGTVASGGHLRLVAPSAAAGSAATNGGNATAQAAEAAALKNRVKDLEGQLAEARRLLEVRNAELHALQRGVSPPSAANTPVPAPPAAVTAAKPVPAPVAAPVTPPASHVAEAPTPPPVAAVPPPAQPPAVPAPVAKKSSQPPAATEQGSWLDWTANNLWLPAAVIVALLAGLGFAAFKRRQKDQIGDFASMAAATDVSDSNDSTSKMLGIRKGDESFVVEESGQHKTPDFSTVEDTGKTKGVEDTLSSEAAVNLDQGDPLAEADFHMAYGLYDQAADLVRIALEREPDRRDLRLKLLEIYFVWGNKDAFLQTAKALEATRDRASAGEWDKIVIMGKQICPDEPMFTQAAGGGKGAAALVDLNLEGGENRVDIDLFGDPEGERSSLDHALAKEHEDIAATGETPHMKPGDGLDFMLDAPERGADESPTREMPPRDEPTVESEMMPFTDTSTQEATAFGADAIDARIANKLGGTPGDQTAEVSIEDLGLDLESLEQTGSPSGILSPLEQTDHPLDQTDHPSDAPTMLAGLDEQSRRMMAEAETRSRDRDLTELERELEASFISELEASHDDMPTAVLRPDSASTIQMPHDVDLNATSPFKKPDLTDLHDIDRADVDSTSKLRGINVESIDLDLDRLANALGTGDTLEQPREDEDLFSSEVFEASQRSRIVDLDVGESVNGAAPAGATSLTAKIQPQNGTSRLPARDDGFPEFEPVTMSEVGTKLDLARAYMDMGDPEGARSILGEVVQEGSASQKQEAQRLIQSLPG
jgi:pilus assembly protein FimV